MDLEEEQSPPQSLIIKEGAASFTVTEGQLDQLKPYERAYFFSKAKEGARRKAHQLDATVCNKRLQLSDEGIRQTRTERDAHWALAGLLEPFPWNPDLTQAELLETVGVTLDEGKLIELAREQIESENIPPHLKRKS